jgi:hypothetical protein
MSYKNVFYGSIINPEEFYSKDDDELDKTIYLPGHFLNHQFVELIKTQGYDLRFHIQVYSSENKSGYLYKNVGVTFYLINKPIIDPGDIKTNLDNCDAQVQTHIDDSNYMDSEECDDENELIIKWVGTYGSGRGKGFAKYLILLSCLYCNIICPRIMFTKLDDDSDKYANGISDPEERELAQSSNIYCKLGYEYEDKDGGPEMQGTIRDILNKHNIAFVPESEPEPEPELRRSKRLKRKRYSGGQKKKISKYKRKKTKTKKKSKRKKSKYNKRKKKRNQNVLEERDINYF